MAPDCQTRPLWWHWFDLFYHRSKEHWKLNFVTADSAVQNLGCVRKVADVNATNSVFRSVCPPRRFTVRVSQINYDVAFKSGCSIYRNDLGPTSRGDSPNLIGNSLPKVSEAAAVEAVDGGVQPPAVPPGRPGQGERRHVRRPQRGLRRPRRNEGQQRRCLPGRAEEEEDPPGCHCGESDMVSHFLSLVLPHVRRVNSSLTLPISGEWLLYHSQIK